MSKGRIRFNGATAFRRWKPAMQSRFVISGEGFNGATAFRRWKPGISQELAYRAWQLQWGHRLSAMETSEMGLAPPV